MKNKKIKIKVIEILNYWDPIGFSKEEEHEYDHFASKIVNLVKNDSDLSKIENHLINLEKSMGLDPPTKRMKEAAIKLHDLCQI